MNRAIRLFRARILNQRVRHPSHGANAGHQPRWRHQGLDGPGPMRARILGLVIVVMLVPASYAAAQPRGVVAAGSHVRLEAASVSPQRVTGIVVSFDETTLKLRVDSGPLVVVPRDAISRLDVRVAHRSNAKAGFLIGAVVGLFASQAGDSGCGRRGTCIVEPPAAAVGVFGGVLLGGVGALIGSLHGKEIWEPVAFGPSLNVAPKRKGGSISLSFRF